MLSQDNQQCFYDAVKIMPYIQVPPFLKHLNICTTLFAHITNSEDLVARNDYNAEFEANACCCFYAKSRRAYHENKVHFSRHHKPVIQLLCEGPFLI